MDSVRHSAHYTDLNRQFHANFKGQSLRKIANSLGFTKSESDMPSYEQALKINEFMLRNNGRAPKPGEI